MEASAQVSPVQVLADEPSALLEYLSKRTAATLGRRVQRADAIVQGSVTGVDVETAGDHKSQVAHLAVERRLAGDDPGDELTLAHAWTSGGTGEADPDIVLSVGDNGVWFLERADGERYRLAADERGPMVDRELADALAWYTQLPGDGDGDARREALSAAIADGNPRIWREAIRALGDSGDEQAAERLRAALDGADDERRERIAAALWRLGRRDEALSAIAPLLDGPARDAWLARWGLAYTVGPDGQRIPELYGPDANAAAGD